MIQEDSCQSILAHPLCELHEYNIVWGHLKEPLQAFRALFSELSARIIVSTCMFQTHILHIWSLQNYFVVDSSYVYKTSVH